MVTYHLLKSLDRFRKSAGLHARFAIRSAQASTPIVARCHPGRGLERAIEGRKRLKARVERDGENRHLHLCWVPKRSPCLGQAVAIDEAAEVAMSELPIDQLSESIFGDAKARAQVSDAQSL